MKKIIAAVSCFVCLNTFAQVNSNEWRNHIGTGEDSIRNEEMMLKFRESYRNQDYNGAYKPMLYLIINAPAVGDELYRMGAAVMYNLTDKESNKVQKNYYHQQMLGVYEMRLSLLDQLNQYSRKPCTRGDMELNEAYYYCLFGHQADPDHSVEKEYVRLKDAMKIVEETGAIEIRGLFLVRLMILSDRFYRDPSRGHYKEQFKADYQLTKSVINKVTEMIKADDDAEYRQKMLGEYAEATKTVDDLWNKSDASKNTKEVLTAAQKTAKTKFDAKLAAIRKKVQLERSKYTSGAAFWK